MKTLIIGLGNPILTDDGVGVLVAEALKTCLDPTHWGSVTIREASLGGLRLMEMMIGYERLILIDALASQHSTHPGQIQRLTMDDLVSISPIQHSGCVHDTNLVTAFNLGQALGYALPKQIVIYGVGVNNVDEFGDRPTPEVANAIPLVVDRVLAEL